jgi:hypothetical protein
MANFSFNANNVTPSASFEPIPAAKYNAVIEATEIKPTSKGDGKRLNLTFSVIGGEFNNRKIFEGLNIENPNSEAQRISLENLSAICHAINVMDLRDTEQLHGKPLVIKVAIKAASGDYEARNVIKGYEAASNTGSTGGQSRPASGGSRPAAANNGGGRPAPQGRPAQQNQGAPARGLQAGGRPAGANQPVRQAPPQETYADQDMQQDYADTSGEFGGEDAAPWDN